MEVQNKIITIKPAFSIEYTNMIKGMALILLMFNHFCVIQDWIIEPNRLIDAHIAGKNLSAYIGAFGKICVAIWAFLSGIGAWHVYQRKGGYTKSLKGLLRLMSIYWGLLFIVFIPLIYTLGLNKFYDLSLKGIFANLFACDAMINKPAWYLRFFILYTITFPIIVYIRNRVKQSFVAYGIIIISLLCLNILSPYINGYNIIQMNAAVILGDYVTYMIVLVSGYIAAEFKWLEKCVSIFPKHINLCIAILVLVLCMALRSYCKFFNIGILSFAMDEFITFFVVASLFALFINANKALQNIFSYLGQASMFIWLFHWIFNLGSQSLQAMIYWPKISFLVIFMALSIGSFAYWTFKKIQNLIH